jgi:Transposase DDE domain
VNAPERSLSPLEAPGARLFERNDDRVLEAFRQGEFDYVEVIGEVSEADFFRAITERHILGKLAESYPSPRKKHEVPLWVYVASDLSMRFHAEHHFYAYPFLIRSGGLLDAFGPEMGHQVIHPQSGDVSLRCAGFNHKNSYDRQTPCDQDYLRKMARQTDAEELQTWFNRDVLGIFKQHHAFDGEGIFMGDASYLFVPDNPRYEGSSSLLFDEHGHPVEAKNLTTEEQKQYTWRRCYKLVTLLHTNRAGEFFLFAGVRVTEGRAHEAPVLYALVEAFVRYHGRGVMKRLILDRGFLDGEKIGQCKKEWGIDVLIPARRDMDIYHDVVGLAEGGFLSFQPVPAATAPLRVVPVHRPEKIRKREEARQRTLAKRKAETAQKAAAVPKVGPARMTGTSLLGRVHSEVASVPELKTWTTCPVPLQTVVNREVYSDGRREYWVLLDTAPVLDPVATRQEYRLRPNVEERYRQLKCFSDLAKFASREFSLVVNQVVFVLLVYSLLQWFWQRQGRVDLLPQTLPRALQRLRPTLHVILIYWQSYVARLSPLQYQEVLLTLEEPARGKILTKTRQLRRELGHQLDHARSP